MTKDEFFHYVDCKGEGNPELEKKFYKTLQHAIALKELSKFNDEWMERYFWGADRFAERNVSSLS